MYCHLSHGSTNGKIGAWGGGGGGWLVGWLVHGYAIGAERIRLDAIFGDHKVLFVD